MTVHITNNNGTSVEIKIDETLTAKKSFELSKLLKVIAKEVVERGIKNDVKKYLENGQIIYVNPFKSLILFGEIWNSSGNSLTASERDNWQKELLGEGKHFQERIGSFLSLKKLQLKQNLGIKS